MILNFYGDFIIIIIINNKYLYQNSKGQKLIKLIYYYKINDINNMNNKNYIKNSNEIIANYYIISFITNIYLKN